LPRNDHAVGLLLVAEGRNRINDDDYSVYDRNISNVGFDNGSRQQRL
jgi:hypothetical protein